MLCDFIVAVPSNAVGTLGNEVNEFDHILLQKNVDSYFLNAADFSYLFIFSEYVIFKTPILFVTSSTRKTTRHA